VSEATKLSPELVETLGLNEEEHGYMATCACCQEPIDPVAGNPGKWGSRAYHDWYHWECIHRAVEYYVKYTYGTYLSPRKSEREFTWKK
jgi:hypothetical protein